MLKVIISPQKESNTNNNNPYDGGIKQNMDNKIEEQKQDLVTASLNATNLIKSNLANE